MTKESMKRFDMLISDLCSQGFSEPTIFKTNLDFFSEEYVYSIRQTLNGVKNYLKTNPFLISMIMGNTLLNFDESSREEFIKNQKRLFTASYSGESSFPGVLIQSSRLRQYKVNKTNTELDIESMLSYYSSEKNFDLVKTKIEQYMPPELLSSCRPMTLFDNDKVRTGIYIEELKILGRELFIPLIDSYFIDEEHHQNKLKKYFPKTISFHNRHIISIKELKKFPQLLDSLEEKEFYHISEIIGLIDSEKHPLIETMTNSRPTYCVFVAHDNFEIKGDDNCLVEEENKSKQDKSSKLMSRISQRLSLTKSLIFSLPLIAIIALSAGTEKQKSDLSYSLRLDKSTPLGIINSSNPSPDDEDISPKSYLSYFNTIIPKDNIKPYPKNLEFRVKYSDDFFATEAYYDLIKEAIKKARHYSTPEEFFNNFYDHSGFVIDRMRFINQTKKDYFEMHGISVHSQILFEEFIKMDLESIARDSKSLVYPGKDFSLNGLYTYWTKKGFNGGIDGFLELIFGSNYPKDFLNEITNSDLEFIMSFYQNRPSELIKLFSYSEENLNPLRSKLRDLFLQSMNNFSLQSLTEIYNSSSDINCRNGFIGSLESLFSGSSDNNKFPDFLIEFFSNDFERFEDEIKKKETDYEKLRYFLDILPSYPPRKIIQTRLLDITLEAIDDQTKEIITLLNDYYLPLEIHAFLIFIRSGYGLPEIYGIEKLIESPENAKKIVEDYKICINEKEKDKCTESSIRRRKYLYEEIDVPVNNRCPVVLFGKPEVNNTFENFTYLPQDSLLVQKASNLPYTTPFIAGNEMNLARNSYYLGKAEFITKINTLGRLLRYIRIR